MHVHVSSSDGEAKYWLEPAVTLAENYGLPERELNKIQKLIKEMIHVFTQAWKKHFKS